MALNHDDVLIYIREYHGNLTVVARRLGVTRQTVYTYLSKHPTAQAAFKEAREGMLDNAESMLYSKALQGETAELIFFLKTQGKSRGYSERVEIVTDPIDWDQVPDSILNAYCDGKLTEADVRRELLRQSRKGES